MTRHVLLLSALTLLLAAPVSAQEDRTLTHIYEAYYKVNYAELPEWDRLFNTYSVPILTEMQSEGVIQGFSHWQHNVGSEYNVRFTMRFYDWADINAAWGDYLGRLNEAMPDADAEMIFSMIEAHHDEIWDVRSLQFPENPGPSPVMYASTFNVNFGDLGAWNEIWDGPTMAVMEGAMEQGILNGVVMLAHNTGGAHNVKVLYLFEEWDDIDDFWNHFFATMGEQHSEAFNEALGMVNGHDDVIWSAAPAPNN